MAPTSPAASPPAARSRRALDYLVSLSVLVVLLVYVAAYFRAPFSGLRIDTTGHITQVAVPRPELQVGDQVIQIDNVTWDAHKDQRRPFFVGRRTGQIVEIVIVRAGQTLTVPWTMPAMPASELTNRLSNVWIFSIVLWAVGTLCLLGVRPRDTRWRLLVIFNYLTAIWIVAGVLSFSRLLASAQVMRAGLWLSVPVYLHLHWLFPRPLARLPRLVWPGLYGLGLALAAAEVLNLPPSELYFLGFLVATGGSLILLGWRYWARPAERRDLRLVAVAAGSALLPAVLLGLAGLVASVGTVMVGLFFGLPMVPITYLYVIYRRQLGALEWRVNRALSFYLFLIVALPAAVVADALLQAWVPPTVAGLVVAGFISAGAVFGFGKFQGWVERRILHVPAPPDRLLETFSERAAASRDVAGLMAGLRELVLQPMLIEQSALVQRDALGQMEALYTQQVAAADLPERGELARLIDGGVRLRIEAELPSPWVRLVLPLAIEGRPTGVWLLGRRPPDDEYAGVEVATLQAIAHQLALALSHLSQSERLRGLVQADLNQRENERTRVARELHDEVLSELAAVIHALLDSPAADLAVPRLQALGQLIRDTIQDLRPAVLDQGLWHALTNVTDEAADAAPSLAVALDIPPTQARYAPAVEQHLYRIVRQACDNARLHAQARSLRIGGTLSPQRVELQVSDDGVGFNLDGGEGLDQHLAALGRAGHYGLAGMVERANLIGAQFRLDTRPGQGTTIHLTWEGTPRTGDPLAGD